MKRQKNYLKRAIFYLAFIAFTYYLWLPPIHIQSTEFWAYAFLLAFLGMVLFVGGLKRQEKVIVIGGIEKVIGYYSPKKSAVKLFSFLVLLGLLVGIGGFISSTPIFHAKSYANLINKESANFAEDVKSVPANKILTVDRDTAIRLGNRKMGEVVELVSQFTVSEECSQINYKGVPVRVSPLQYASPIKWFTNHSEGIPYYMTVNMLNGETDLVKLDKAIRYSKSEYFNRFITRKLRFQYPFKMFDLSSIEIDDTGKPYWVTPVYHKRIGLFGGLDVGELILTDAQTGESTLYPIDKVPTWIDRAFDSNLLMQQINWNGQYQNGFINSKIGQKGVLRATAGYNYLALQDDVYVYTGITSVSSDASNIGFVLINMRTKECNFYSVPSAEEFSAMASAEGAVQEKNYRATFPLLLNMNSRPTYFLSLKDQAGLIKTYAFIDAENYQNVVIGATVKEAYDKFLKQGNFFGSDETEEVTKGELKGKVTAIESVVIEGNSYFYLMLEGHKEVYVVPITVADFMPFVKAGETLTLTFGENGGDSKRVYEVKRGV